MKAGLHLLRPAAAVGVFAALAVIPTEVLASLPVVCIWRTFLDVECPGCGMTRALSSALHGHLSEAVAFNRGVLLVLPVAFIILISDCYALWSAMRVTFRRKGHPPCLSRRLVLAAARST